MAAQSQEEPATTIANLTEYNPRWRIEARVVKKNSIKTFQYKDGRGEGKLFSIELLDKSEGQTRATFFGNMVDQHFMTFVEGHMYSFAKGKLKKANAQWYTKGNLEITFEEGSIIYPIAEDTSCPRNLFDIQTIMALKEKPPKSDVDIAGVISDVEGATEIPLKAGGMKARNNITIVDDSGASIRFTLWGDEAGRAGLQEGAAVILKSAKVSDFGGCSLSTSFSTTLYLGSEAEAVHPRAAHLRQWYAASGEEAKQSCEALSRGGGPSAPATLAELQQEALGLELPQGGAESGGAGGAAANEMKYHTVMPATITFFHSERQPFYRACPYEVKDERSGKMRACLKKVEEQGNCWSCAVGHECQTPTARWLTSFAVADHTGVQYVSGFDDTLAKVFGVPAQEFADKWDRKGSDPAALTQVEEVFKARQFSSWRLRLRSKKELWNDEERLKVQVVEAEKLNHCRTGRLKLAEIKASLGPPRRALTEARSGGA